MVNESEGGLEKFSKGYDIFGFSIADNGNVTYREWAPNAEQAFLVGDFSKCLNIGEAVSLIRSR